MTPRSIRRAAERKTLKQALKAARNSEQQPLATPPDALATPAQLSANRANALKSTGPRTEQGKLRIRHNAVRHALTGQSVLLPEDDAVFYESHCKGLHAELKPVGIQESLLVQAIADHHWRLTRIPSLEAGIYAVGRNRFP